MVIDLAIYERAIHAAREQVCNRWQGWSTGARDEALREYRQTLRDLVDAISPERAIEFCLEPKGTTRSDELCQVSISPTRVIVEANEPFFQPNPYHFSLGLRLIAALLLLPLAGRHIGAGQLTFTLALGDDSTGADVGFCAKDDCFLIPDPEFLFTRGYVDFRAGVLANWVPWNARQRGVFWRGSTTGFQRHEYPSSGPEWYKVLPRTEMCARLRKPPYNSFCDVGISAVVQIEDPVLVERIETELKADHVHRLDQIRWGFLIDIDGNTNSWGMLQALILGACVIKIESSNKQWYYGALRPDTNIVSIKGDFSDLEEKLEQLVRQPKRAERIAASGHALAGKLAFESALAGTAKRLAQRFT